MAPTILLVDDERDILRLLHSALLALANPDLQVLEASSGEDALDILEGTPVDLLVTDFNLPAMDGMQTAAQARSAQPGIRVIHITANYDRDLRQRMLSDGAVAVFNKPVPLGDFVDAVQRGLGLTRTILQTEDESSAQPEGRAVADLVADIRRDLGLEALFVVSNRGRIAAQAGSLKDSSMEVSLLSSATATFNAASRLAEANHQTVAGQFTIIRGGDQDLILVPLDAFHALLATGVGLAETASLAETVRALLRAGDQLAPGLKRGSTPPATENRGGGPSPPYRATGAPDDLLQDASKPELGSEELDAYWEAGAAQHGDKTNGQGGISYDEARRRGLALGEEG